jgi:hypothetical protein
VEYHFVPHGMKPELSRYSPNNPQRHSSAQPYREPVTSSVKWPVKISRRASAWLMSASYSADICSSELGTQFIFRNAQPTSEISENPPTLSLTGDRALGGAACLRWPACVVEITIPLHRRMLGPWGA